MTSDEILGLIHTAFPEAQVELQDLAGDNNHYALTVTCASFSGKSRVQQHKMVYGALGDKMGTQLHALAVTTKTPN